MAEEAEVTSIKVIDRLDCCQYRFEEVEVKVGFGKGYNDPSSVSCGVQSHKGSSITYIYNCPAKTRGNYISIKKLGTTFNFFHVDYVEVSICSK